MYSRLTENQKQHFISDNVSTEYLLQLLFSIDLSLTSLIQNWLILTSLLLYIIFCYCCWTHRSSITPLSHGRAPQILTLFWQPRLQLDGLQPIPMVFQRVIRALSCGGLLWDNSGGSWAGFLWHLGFIGRFMLSLWQWSWSLKLQFQRAGQIYG